MPAELAALLGQVVEPGGRFGHRQHIHLGYLAVRQYGSCEAALRLCDWIQHIAAYEHAPQKYNATMTRAWTLIVGHHVDLDPTVADFDAFVACHPGLLDKRLIARHYRAVTLASPAARSGWVEPDLAPFPW